MSVRLAVVLPAGPDDDAPDTLASVLAYCPPPRGVVVIDDAGGGHAHLRDAAAGVHVIPTPPGAPGSRGGLYAKLAAGYRFALARLPFEPGSLITPFSSSPKPLEKSGGFLLSEFFIIIDFFPLTV